MTREEAIRVLEDNRPSVIFEDEDVQKRMAELCRAIDMAIESLSGDAVHTDCTDFVNWLLEEVMDEEMWELNAVAYGEVIARKLKKLGLLEVKDGYYVRHIENNTKESDLVYRPSAEVVQGEWEDKEVFNETDDDHIVDEWQSARCSVCGKYHTTPYMYYFDNFNYCPNCGAKMKGGAE